MPLNSADAFPHWSPIQKKERKKNPPQIPLTRFTHVQTQRRRFAWQHFGKRRRQVQCSANRLTLRHAQSESRPVQTKSWTSEPCGNKLKVWLLVEMGLLEVTSGKCLCLTHFTAYSHLTSDFLTGSEAADYLDFENFIWIFAWEAEMFFSLDVRDLSDKWARLVTRIAFSGKTEESLPKNRSTTDPMIHTQQEMKSRENQEKTWNYCHNQDPNRKQIQSLFLFSNTRGLRQNGLGLHFSGFFLNHSK